MTPTSKLPVVASVFLGLLLVLPATARAQSSCEGTLRRGHETLVFFLGGIPASDATVNIVVKVDSLGLAEAHGTAGIQDGTSNTILWAEKYHAPVSCVDVNGDGFAGITGLLLEMRDVRTREVVPVVILPADGELGDDDVEQVVIVIGADTFTESVRVKPLFAFLVVR